MSYLGNNNFTGIQSAVSSRPSNIVANSVVSVLGNFDNLNATNTPIVGTTIKAYPPAYIFNSPLPNIAIGQPLFCFNAVDLNGNLIQLPLDTNKFFTGCVGYWNLFGPGAGGSWITNPGFLIGTSTTNPTTMNHSINYLQNGAIYDGQIYPLMFGPITGLPQISPYYPCMNVVTGGTFVAHEPLYPTFNNLIGQFCGGVTDTTNYLTIGFTQFVGINWTPGTNPPVGSFIIYLTYMTMI